MSRITPAAALRSRTVMMAAVLGTALVAGSPSRASAREVSHEAIQDISRYCQTCWRNARLPADRWTDCTQEVLTRLLERLEPQQWTRVLKDDEGEERREFLRAIDAVKKRTQRARKFAAISPDLPARTQRTENTLRDDREVFARAAAEVLSLRQRSILQYTVDGWTIPEIAEELGTTVERVSDEKYKAIRKLRHHLVG